MGSAAHGCDSPQWAVDLTLSPLDDTQHQQHQAMRGVVAHQPWKAGPASFKLLPSFPYQQICLCELCFSLILSKLMNLSWKNPWPNSWGVCV